MPTLEENIKQAIDDFDDIKAAIEEKGVEVPNGTDTSEYGNKIRSIQGDGSGNDILVVQYDERQGASHSYQEVYDHIAGGGVAVLEEHGCYYSFSMCNGHALFFFGFDDERALHGYEFHDGGVTKIDTTCIVDDEYVQGYVDERLAEVGGGIAVTDDGFGNLTITAYAGVSITDDGLGNVVIA